MSRVPTLLAALVVSLTALAVVPTPAAATSWSGVTEYPCASESALASSAYAYSTTIRFENSRNEGVSLYWLNYQGQRVWYASIPSGYYVLQQTFATHPWVIVSASGVCLDIFVATPSYGNVHLTATSSAPRYVAAVAGPGAGQITTSWSAPAIDGGHAVTSYRVYRWTSSAGETLVGQTSATTFRDTGLANGALYVYRITAVNAAGESSRSDQAQATTFGLPGAPSSITAGPGQEVGSVRISWSSPQSSGGTPVTGYRVFRGTSPTALAPIATLGVEHSFVDQGLDPLRTYHYAVRARNIVGEGPASATACSKPWPWVQSLLPGECALPSPPV